MEIKGGAQKWKRGEASLTQVSIFEDRVDVVEWRGCFG